MDLLSHPWMRSWHRYGFFDVSGCFAGQHRAVKNGNAQTRRLQGTGTKSIIETHFSPKQWMTCVCEERTASR